MKIFTKFLTAALALGANANVETKKEWDLRLKRAHFLNNLYLPNYQQIQFLN